MKKIIEIKKNLLIYAHYFVPDTASTGQILYELAEGMLECFNIFIICAVPSYTGKIEKDYKTQKFYFEEINGISIIRVRVPEFSKAKKMSRIINILSYFLGAIKATNIVGEMDYVFSISQPPIFGGILGCYGKRKKHAKFIYNIQDFNPEQVLAINYSKNKLVIKIMMYLDKLSCKKSDLIITVGRDLVETLEKRFNKSKKPKVIMINNWIDEKTICPINDNDINLMRFKEKYGIKNKFVIMYSGNIGLYYDLENIVKVINRISPKTVSGDGREVLFVFAGDGALLEKLKKYVQVNKMSNVKFIPYQEKSELVYSLNAADLHWCVNAKGIKGVSCPSKYYGIAATMKPVIGVLEKGSEIRCIIEESEGGLCSEPGDYEKIENNLRWFIDNSNSELFNKMGYNGWKYLNQHLTKEMSVKKYEKSILDC